MRLTQNSFNERTLAKQNRLINIKNPADFEEALQTAGTPTYQNFWQLVWLKQLTHAAIIQHIILQLMRQATASDVERREFLQAYWQHYLAQALKEQDKWHEKSVEKTLSEQAVQQTIASTILQEALPLWQNFRLEITQTLSTIDVAQKQIKQDWQALQAENREMLLKEHAFETLLYLGGDGQFHELRLDPHQPANEVNEILQAGEVQLMDEKLVKELARSYDFDVKRPEPIALPIDPCTESAADTPPKKKEKKVNIADMMKHGHVLAELKANAACLKQYDFEKNPLKAAAAQEQSSLDLSHALLQVTTHNRKVFKTNVVSTKKPKTELEEKRNADFAARKKREEDLLAKYLETQLHKIDCQTALVKADATIARIDTLLQHAPTITPRLSP